MPEVPKAQLQVAPIPVQGTPVSLSAAPTPKAESFAGMPKAMQQAQDIYANEKKQIDTAAGIEADTYLSSFKTDMLVRASQVKGKDALNIYDSYMAEFDKAAADYGSKNLFNDQQKASYQHILASSRIHLNESLQSHIGNERENYYDGVYKSALESGANELALHATDKNTTQRDFLITKAEVITRGEAQRKGYDEDMTKAAVQSVSSKGHSIVINQMVTAGNDLVASAYYTEHKDGMTAGDRATIEKILEPASRTGEANRLMDKHWNPANSVYDMTEAMRKETKDPETLKVATALIKERKGEFDQAQKDFAIKAESTVYKAISAQGGISINNLRKMPEYLALDGGDRLKALNALQAEQERGAKKEATDGQWKAYAKYSEVNALSAMSEDEIISKVGEIGRPLADKLLIARRELDKVGLDGARIDADQFNTLAGDSGLNLTDKPMVARLRDNIKTRILAEESAAKRKFSYDEKGELMQKMLDETVMLNEWGRDPRVPAATVSKEGEANSYVNLQDEPPDMVESAKATLKARGVEPSDYNISELIVAHRFNDKARRDAVLGGK